MSKETVTQEHVGRLVRLRWSVPGFPCHPDGEAGVLLAAAPRCVILERPGDCWRIFLMSQVELLEVLEVPADG